MKPFVYYYIVVQKVVVVARGFLAKQLLLILPLFVVLVIALCIAYLSISVGAPRIPVVPFLQEYEMKAILVNVSFFVGIASLSISLVYSALKKGWTSLLEKVFAMGGGILTLFLSGILSINLFKLVTSIFLFLLVWFFNFFIAFSIALTVAGVFSEETRNVLFMMYSSVAGSFLGMGIPMFSMVYILLSVSLIDLVSYRIGILGKIADLSEGEAIFFRYRYSDKELLIGWGDLVYYSMFASYSLVNFGALITIFSFLLILIGWVFTFFFMTRIKIFAGLPIPITLGLMPIMLELNPIYLFLLAIPIGLDRLIVIVKPKMVTRIQRLGKSKLAREFFIKNKIVKVPKYPKIRIALGFVNLITVLVVTPLVLTPLATLLNVNFSISIQHCLLVSFITYKLLFTHLSLAPFVYIGIFNGIYLVMTKRVQRFFTATLLLSYLFLTTVMVPFQFHLTELFRSIIFILPLYTSVTFSLIYSLTEPSVSQGGPKENIPR